MYYSYNFIQQIVVFFALKKLIQICNLSNLLPFSQTFYLKDFLEKATILEEEQVLSELFNL